MNSIISYTAAAAAAAAAPTLATGRPLELPKNVAQVAGATYAIQQQQATKQATQQATRQATQQAIQKQQPTPKVVKTAAPKTAASRNNSEKKKK